MYMYICIGIGIGVGVGICIYIYIYIYIYMDHTVYGLESDVIFYNKFVVDVPDDFLYINITSSCQNYTINI